MSYYFTMCLGAQWGQKVQNFQSSTECRGNKDVFTPLLCPHPSTHQVPHLIEILPKSVALKVISMVYS